MNGELMELSTVPDETFAGGVLGQGIAIVPSEGKLYSPVDGVVTNVFDTKHAICLQTPSGAEMIIHIGLETVSLGGKHFEAKVSTDQQVKKGDLLIEFDLDEIKKEFKTCTPVLITNADDYASIDIPKTSGKVKVGDPIYTAKA
jgi:glucose-specific phosphotransferase system IIA component